MPKSLLTTDAFWHFSCDFYQQPKVQSALLLLQEQHNANINLALLCIWLDKHALALQKKTLFTMHEDVGRFSAEYTKPLRQLRLHFKTHSDTLSNYQALRSHLLNAELCLEQQEQALLISGNNQSQLTPFTQAHQSNLKNYLTQVLSLSKTDLDQISLQALFIDQ